MFSSSWSYHALTEIENVADYAEYFATLDRYCLVFDDTDEAWACREQLNTILDECHPTTNFDMLRLANVETLHVLFSRDRMVVRAIDAGLMGWGEQMAWHAYDSAWHACVEVLLFPKSYQAILLRLDSERWARAVPALQQQVLAESMGLSSSRYQPVSIELADATLASLLVDQLHDVLEYYADQPNEYASPTVRAESLRALQLAFHNLLSARRAYVTSLPADLQLPYASATHHLVALHLATLHRIYGTLYNTD